MGRGFSSAGQTSEMNRIERMLQNNKGSKVTMGIGTPLERDGGIGDITVRTVADGIRCYIKTESGWVDVNTMVPSTQLEWHDMVLVNSFLTYSSDTYTPAYTKDANGFVHLRGAVRAATTATITTFPLGFRPSSDVYMTGGRITSSPYAVIFKVTDAGVLTATKNSHVSGMFMDGLSFYAGETVSKGGGTGSGGGSGGLAGGGGGTG